MVEEFNEEKEQHFLRFENEESEWLMVEQCPFEAYVAWYQEQRWRDFKRRGNPFYLYSDPSSKWKQQLEFGNPKVSFAAFSWMKRFESFSGRTRLRIDVSLHVKRPKQATDDKRNFFSPSRARFAMFEDTLRDDIMRIPPPMDLMGEDDQQSDASKNNQRLWTVEVS